MMLACLLCYCVLCGLGLVVHCGPKRVADSMCYLYPLYDYIVNVHTPSLYMHANK